MTLEDIAFLDNPSVNPAPVQYDPAKLAQWQSNSGGKELPAGLVFGESLSPLFLCPNSLFNVDIYDVTHTGNGWHSCDSPESAVECLKGWLGSEDTQAKDYLLSKIPPDLVERLKELDDEESIEGDSDWGCKWKIEKDVRTVHSDDLYKIFDKPTIRLKETESGDDKVTIPVFTLSCIFQGLRTWKYNSPAVLVEFLSRVIRVNDEATLVRELTSMRPCDTLSIRGTTYSDNEVSLFTANKELWQIDRKGKTLLETAFNSSECNNQNKENNK